MPVLCQNHHGIDDLRHLSCYLHNFPPSFFNTPRRMPPSGFMFLFQCHPKRKSLRFRPCRRCLHFGDGNVVRIRTHHGLSHLMHQQHQPLRLHLVFVKDIPQYVNHKVHCGKIVIVHDHFILLRFPYSDPGTLLCFSLRCHLILLHPIYFVFLSNCDKSCPFNAFSSSAGKSSGVHAKHGTPSPASFCAICVS